MNRIYDIKIAEQTNNKIRFEILKNEKVWHTTPLINKEEFIESITEEFNNPKLDHNLDSTIKGKIVYKTVEQILNDISSVKCCTSCGRLSLITRPECWNCNKINFIKFTDEHAGKYFKEDAPSGEVRI